MNEERAKELLAEGLCTVTFKKKDGSEHTRVLTRSNEHIPEDHRPKGGKTTNPYLAAYYPEGDRWISIFKLVNIEPLEEAETSNDA